MANARCNITPITHPETSKPFSSVIRSAVALIWAIWILNIGVVGLIININVFGCECLVWGGVSLGGVLRYTIVLGRAPRETRIQAKLAVTAAIELHCYG